MDFSSPTSLKDAGFLYDSGPPQQPAYQGNKIGAAKKIFRPIMTNCRHPSCTRLTCIHIEAKLEHRADNQKALAAPILLP